jgi:hypothetical protein
MRPTLLPDSGRLAFGADPLADGAALQANTFSEKLSGFLISDSFFFLLLKQLSILMSTY